jgi:AIG2-like family.
MSTARLRKRMPSCKPLGIATLPGHALRFHKRSMDKSGKCNAFASGNDNSVIGVLFSFDPAERAKLDEAEGVGSGYEHAMVTVINDKGRRRKVLTYLATPDTSTTASNPMAGTRTLSSQVPGNTACRRSILPNTSSRLK